MKRIVFLIACIWVFSAQATELSKTDIQKLVENGNGFYKNNLFDDAIQSYEKALQGNCESVDIYYNLGNAYFRTADYAHAIINYERALRLSPSDADIQQNLNIANARITDKVDEVPQLLIVDWANAVVNFFSSKQWAALSIIFMVLTCFLIGIFIVSGKYKLKKTCFYAGLTFFVFAILSFTCAQLLCHRQHVKNEAIVVQPLLVAKSSPSESGLDKFVIHEGTKVQLEDSVDNWVKIKLPNDNIGWVEKEGIEVI